MPDITMCFGYGCPLKENCHRYLADPDRHQSYFALAPYDIEKEVCEYYLKEKEKNDGPM